MMETKLLLILGKHLRSQLNESSMEEAEWGDLRNLLLCPQPCSSTFSLSLETTTIFQFDAIGPPYFVLKTVLGAVRATHLSTALLFKDFIIFLEVENSRA